LLLTEKLTLRPEFMRAWTSLVSLASLLAFGAHGVRINDLAAYDNAAYDNAAALDAREKPVSNSPTCGMKGEASANAQIVKGDKTSACEWRWQVALTGGPASVPFCGGTLIAAEWVLTAAHCVTAKVLDRLAANKENLTVIAGDIYGYSYQARVVGLVAREDHYDNKTNAWDFALLKLATPMDLNGCAGSVCLPAPDQDVQPGTKCWITGYGRTEVGGELSKGLQQARVNILSNFACNFRRLHKWGSIKSNMVCAAGSRIKGSVDSAAQDTCQGDSGGPLVCESADGQWTVYGVTSWGLGCGNPWKPGVYARVHKNLEWIHRTMEWYANHTGDGEGVLDPVAPLNHTGDGEGLPDAG